MDCGTAKYQDILAKYLNLMRLLCNKNDFYVEKKLICKFCKLDIIAQVVKSSL